MKKLMKITLGIVIASLFIGMTFAKADFSVTTGLVNTYTVNDSEWNIVFDTNSSSGTGFQFEDTLFAEGTQFTVTVDAQTNTTVDYTVNVGAKSDTSSYSALGFALGTILLLIFPILVSAVVPDGSFNQTEADMGLGLMTSTFVEPTLANELFYQFTNETFETSMSTGMLGTGWTIDEMGGTFDNATDIALFTWVFNGKYVNATTNTDVSGKYTYTTAYDQTTGVVMGTRLDFDYSGTVEGLTFKMDFLQEIEILGYNLPGGAGFISLEWFIVLPALTFVGLLGAVIKKRKQ